MAIDPRSELHLTPAQETPSSSVDPRLSLEKIEPALSAGTFSQGGKLFIFTLRETKSDGTTHHLSMDSQTRTKIGHVLTRLFQANYVGAAQGKGNYLGSDGVEEFSIALDKSNAEPIQVKTQNGLSALSSSMLDFLKGNNPRQFNFLNDVQKTVLSSSYKSAYLDTLSEDEKEKRTKTLEDLDKQFDIYDDITTNLRISKYADYDDLAKMENHLWLKPDVLHYLISEKAYQSDPDDYQTAVSPPLIFEYANADISTHIQSVKQLISDPKIDAIALPLHEFYKDKDCAGTYGLYIDLKKKKVYFYNPSKSPIKEDSPLGQFISLLCKNIDPQFKTPIFSDEKDSTLHSKTKSHLGLHPFEPMRKFKHHLKAVQNRSLKEERSLTHILDTYNDGRYVLKFFDQMLQAQDKEKTYKDFINSKIKREEIEDYCDDLATNIMANYHRKYSEIHSFV